jgi:hypothetical protein
MNEVHDTWIVELAKRHDSGPDWENTPFARITRNLYGIQIGMSATGLDAILNVLRHLTDEELQAMRELARARRDTP